MKITVVDVQITEREVELALQCPHCDAPLATESYQTTLMTVGLSEVEDRGRIEIGGGLTEPSLVEDERYEDDARGTLDVVCVACDKSVLVEPGTLRVIREDGVTVNA